MHKLLLLDIDGTLVDEKYGIPSSAIQAIHLCQKKGYYVVICTGRSIGTIQDEVLSMDVDGYIAGGGCYIEFHHDILYNESFSKEKMKECVKILKDSHIAFAIESQEKVYMNEQAKDIFMQSLHSKGLQLEKIVYENNMNQYHEEAIHKICLWTKGDELLKIKDILQEEMEITQEYDGYVEMIKRGCNKGDAIRYLCKKLNIYKKDIICFGDGQNDIEMFKASAIKIAMPSSHEDLKKIASSICGDIMNHGIYNELKRRNII